MLLSMTGFGEAQRHQDGLTVAVEVRTVNSRYLKLSVRTSDGYGALEPKIESLIRKQIRRATVQVNVYVKRPQSSDDYQIDTHVLEIYRQQLDALQADGPWSGGVSLESLLALPGVVCESSHNFAKTNDVLPLAMDALKNALTDLQKMRTDEGQAMAVDLKANTRMLTASLDEVQRRSPLVVEAYRKRLAERLEKILAEFDVAIHQADVLKEVGLFADRSDISEEIVRLRSHVEQFQTMIDEPECSGRKLEFLSQEMTREANTIGSKANDVEISRHVIEIKAAVERIREMIQNVE